MEWCVFKRAHGNNMYMVGANKNKPERLVWSKEPQEAKRFPSKEIAMQNISDMHIKYVFARPIEELIEEEETKPAPESSEEIERLTAKVNFLEKKLDTFMNQYRDDKIKMSLKRQK